MRARGFTLLEMMIATAIGSIVLSSAVGVFAVILNQRRAIQQTVATYDSLNIATSLLQYDATNAGWRLPSAPFAVRVIDNVTAATQLRSNGLDGTQLISEVDNCSQSGWGLVHGSDVLELTEGYTAEPTGSVQTATGQTSIILKGNTAPLSTVGTRALLVFADALGNACLASTTTAALAGSPVPITMRKPDFSTDSNAGTRYVTTASQLCPQADMNVYRVGKRTRYLLCHDLTDLTTPPVLFRQVSDDTGDLAAGGFQRLQDGVADLQFGLKVMENGTTGLGPGGNCTPMGALSQTCQCNVGTAPCSGNDQNTKAVTFAGTGNSDVVNAKSAITWVRGLVIGVTAVSVRQAGTGVLLTSPEYQQPALLNHPAPGIPGTGHKYLRTQMSVALSNLTMVTP